MWLGSISSPLGPFVPAPPEVAMQMLREQGGPSPFEGGGRNGRSGPQLSGPAPIIALPQAFRQDPRRLRRQVIDSFLLLRFGLPILFVHVVLLHFLLQ